MLKFTSFLSTIFLLFLGITVQAQTTCPAPYQVSTESDSNKIIVKWASQSTTTNANTTYTVAYAVAPTTATSVWTTLPATPNKTLTISNLSKCTNYNVRVKSNCSATSSSTWTPAAVVKTKGCVVIVPCLAPSTINATADSNKIALSWLASTIPSATYTIEYTAAPFSATSVWTTATSTTTTFTLANLSKCKEYAYRIKTNCSAISSSGWSSYKITKTTGCVVVPPCLKPVYTTVADSNKVTLSWATITGSTYQVQYAAAPISSTTAWNSATATTSPATITGLLKCKEYVIRVRKVCSNNTFSDWETKTVKTTGCVVAPPCSMPIYTTVVDSNKITLAWTTIVGSTYQVQYAAAPVSSTTAWNSIIVTTNPATITDLLKCKEYVIRVRKVCSNNTFSDWETKTVKTTGCVIVPPCLKPVYTAIPDSNKVTLSWTTPNNNYQIEYTAVPTTGTTVTPTWTPVTVTANPTIITGLAKCTYYSVRVRTICANGLFSEWETKGLKTTGCTIVLPCQTPNFLLYPDSTSFKMGWAATAGATFVAEYTTAPATATSLWKTISTNTTTFPIIVSGLVKCTEYAVRMRCSNANIWETKTVKTTGCIQKNCPKPAIFSFVEDSTKVSFAWTALPGIPFHVAYTAAPALATSTWTSTTITANPLTISGLTKCKEYVLRIRSVCASDYLSEWETKTFKTKGCPPPTPCIKPALLSSTPIAGGVTLNWSGTSQCYQVRYAKKTTTAAVWKTDSVCMKWHTIIDLDPCTFYAWQVRSRCSDGVWGEWTSKSTFETGGCSERIAKTMTLSPNPGTHLNVAYYLRKAGNVSLEITNLQGVPMGKYELGKQEVGENTYSLDNLDFAAGSYLVFIKVNGIRLEVQRWIKNVE